MRVSVLALVMTLSAVPAFAQSQAGGWFDVNFIGAASQQSEETFTYSRILFGETAASAVAYPDMGTAKGPEFAGGGTFGNGLGFGIRFLRVKTDYVPGMAISIPHPGFFNRSATDADVLNDELERNDLDLDFFVLYDFPTPGPLRIRVFGGPTYFKIKQEMIGEIRYDQLVIGLSNAVNITEGRFTEIEGSGWGFNAGADVAYFFTNHVGVGGVVRFNSGNVTIDEPLSGEEAELKAGRTTFGAGLRLRF